MTLHNKVWIFCFEQFFNIFVETRYKFENLNNCCILQSENKNYLSSKTKEYELVFKVSGKLYIKNLFWALVNKY